MKSSFHSSNNEKTADCGPSTQAIEGLTLDDRVKVQTLCQDWWDSSQEDASIFRMALAYQQYVQENFFRSSIQDQ